MSENIDIGGESLANRAPIELIKALEENISSIDSDKTDEKQETETVEVHHHTHHVVLKNWNIYLWEFVMLFLAVLCGFLAENLRENRVERKREKQYIRTLISDVQTDLLNINNRINEYSGNIYKIDTILNNFDAFTSNFSVIPGRYFFDIIYNHDDFIYTDRTMQQLKYAGGLRLIRSNTSDSIVAYDADVKYMFMQVDYNTAVYVQLIDLSTKMISYKNAIGTNKTKQLDKIETGNSGFWIEHDPKLFKQLYNRLLLYSLTNNYSVIRLKGLRTRGTNLVRFLKTEYHIR